MGKRRRDQSTTYYIKHVDRLTLKTREIGNTIPKTSTQIVPTVHPNKEHIAYEKEHFRYILSSKQILTTNFEDGINRQSKTVCETLLGTGRLDKPKAPQIFQDDQFAQLLEVLKDSNEMTLMYELMPWLVPPVTLLKVLGRKEELKHLRTSFNTQWTCSLPVLEAMLPHPNYTVGFDFSAFTPEQLGLINIPEPSLYLATRAMIFPFLMVEMNCSLDIADLQNAYSAATAVKGLIKLFSLVNRDKELNSEILAFTISCNRETFNIQGHYPVLNGNTWQVYIHDLAKINLNTTSNQNKAYQLFIVNVYDFWMPEHLTRLRSVLAGCLAPTVPRSSSSSPVSA
jgi:hypothetical protein